MGAEPGADLRADLRALVQDVRAHAAAQKLDRARWSEAELELPSMARTEAARVATAAPGVVSDAAESASDRAATLASIRADLGDCQRCALAGGRTHIVFGEGNPHAALCFVGEAPGAEEDKQGRPFVGSAGQMLTDMIEKVVGLKRDGVYIANVLKCRPPGNRNPEPAEVAQCRPFLERQLAAMRPRVVVALGKFAAHTLLDRTDPISRLRGNFFGAPWDDACRVMPTFHPAYLLRNPADKRLVFADLLAVRKELETIPGLHLAPVGQRPS